MHQNTDRTIGQPGQDRIRRHEQLKTERHKFDEHKPHRRNRREHRNYHGDHPGFTARQPEQQQIDGGDGRQHNRDRGLHHRHQCARDQKNHTTHQRRQPCAHGVCGTALGKKTEGHASQHRKQCGGITGKRGGRVVSDESTIKTGRAQVREYHADDGEAAGQVDTVETKTCFHALSIDQAASIATRQPCTPVARAPRPGISHPMPMRKPRQENPAGASCGDERIRTSGPPLSRQLISSESHSATLAHLQRDLA